MSASLIEIARTVLSPLDAPAGFLSSELIVPERADDGEEADVDEWVALDAQVARQLAEAGSKVVLRAGPGARALIEAPRLDGIELEAVVMGKGPRALEEAAAAVLEAMRAGVRVRAVLAAGETGIDAYRAAAAARQRIGTSAPIRARWDGVLDVKGAALALTFGADELAGPLAPRRERFKLAQVGGPPEDAHRPSPAHVEELIRAAGRLPARRS
jgi:hypothetical protein